MNEKFKQYLPYITKSKDLLIYAAISIILILTAFTVTGKLIASYQNAQETKAKIVSMNTFLQEWTNKTNLLNNTQYRPIKSEYADSVQSSLLSNLAANKLELVGFKAISQNDKKKINKDYELTIQGDYAPTMAYLNNFHANDALINIQNLKMQQQQGKIVTIIKYRVYILK